MEFVTFSARDCYRSKDRRSIIGGAPCWAEAGRASREVMNNEQIMRGRAAGTHSRDSIRPLPRLPGRLGAARLHLANCIAPRGNLVVNPGNPQLRPLTDLPPRIATDTVPGAWH